MTKTFTFDSSSYGRGPFTTRLQITVELGPGTQEEGEVLEVLAETADGTLLDLVENLSDGEQKELWRLAEELAYENAYDLWFEGQLSQADALHDSWKDGDRD